VFEQIDARGLADQISCLIYLTDLYGRFPDRMPPYPVLWAATTELPVPFGSRILVKEND
jgi:predicted metal-dependent peptidase